jgi:hypothetical protein
MQSSAAVWITEAQGVERRRRAAAQHIAELTGTEPLRWTGQISAENWTKVLSAGADALLAITGDPEHTYALDLVESAEKYAAQAADLDDDTAVDLTRSARTEHQIDELLTAQEPDLTDDLRTPAVDAAIATWSPFSATRCAAARHVVRCKDGSRRYGNGEPSQEVA